MGIDYCCGSRLLRNFRRIRFCLQYTNLEERYLIGCNRYKYTQRHPDLCWSMKLICAMSMYTSSSRPQSIRFLILDSSGSSSSLASICVYVYDQVTCRLAERPLCRTLSAGCIWQDGKSKCQWWRVGYRYDLLLRVLFTVDEESCVEPGVGFCR